MEKFNYTPKGVCSRELQFEIEDGIVNSLNVVGGCPGNLKGISSLVKGRSVDDIIDCLDGIQCREKPTSCPDQIAQALKSYKSTH